MPMPLPIPQAIDAIRYLSQRVSGTRSFVRSITRRFPKRYYVRLTHGRAEARHVDRSDTRYLPEFQKKRTGIWTFKYHETDLTDGLELDFYDNFSTYLLLIYKGKVVGGCRFIYMDTLSALPVGVYILGLTDGVAVEMSRFWIAGVSPRDAKRLLRFLITVSLDILKRKGLRVVYATLRAALRIQLHETGVPTHRMGPSQYHANKEFVPVCIWFHEIHLFNSSPEE